MSDADLFLSKYPTITEAVAFTELIVCGVEDGESSWSTMLDAKLTPDEILRCIQSVADESGDGGGVPEDVLARVRSQVRSKEYRTYLAGKLGLT